MAETDDPADRPTSVPETDKACDMLLEIVSSLEEIDREMQLQRLKAFLLVARHPECNTRQLARMAGMSSSTMSRNLSSLGEWNPLAKKEGYGLISGHDVQDDRRNKVRKLTAKGQLLLTSLRVIYSRYTR